MAKVQDIYGSDSEDMAVERHALSLRFAHDNNQDYITCPLARLVQDVQGNWTQDDLAILKGVFVYKREEQAIRNA